MSKSGKTAAAVDQGMNRQGVNITSVVHTHSANEGSGDSEAVRNCVQVKSIQSNSVLFSL